MLLSTAALSLVVLLCAIVFLAFGILLFVRWLRTKIPDDPAGVSPRTLEALNYRGTHCAPTRMELRELGAAREHGVRRQPEPPMDGEQLPSYQAAAKDAVPPLDLAHTPPIEPPPLAISNGNPIATLPPAVIHAAPPVYEDNPWSGRWPARLGGDGRER
ncbi:hypothetical protein CALCODRAFT_498995 [Calocera cornea HHB12733]|uniref:Uncharacterized protein n=1 Tax=Calocera cornea HHB12733 TaxID=1353952 RepID=A0A165EMP7_9BASI|nr:hypothetical protein CALCODRAFT_498995 [Calocera cornea HHB12733]